MHCTYDVRNQLCVGSTMNVFGRLSRLVPALLLAPTIAAAQPPSQGSEEMIPRELVLALLNFGPGMGGASDIRVGRLADGIPPELVPPGVQVLGSTTQFDNALIVLAAPQQPDSAIGSIEAHLLANGWTKPPTPQIRQQRGFVAAEFSFGGYQPPDMLCRGDAFLTYSGSYRRTGGSVIRLSLSRGQRYSACRMREEATTYRNPFEEAPVPTLRAPMGSVTKDGGGMSGSGQDLVTMSTRLGARLNPAEVVSHYDKQMRDQGWTVGPDASAPFLSARTYSKNDEKARTWSAILMATTLADSTDHDVLLRLRRK
jgi:hypothetical protein